MKPSDNQLSKSVKSLKRPVYGAKFKLTIPDFKALSDPLTIGSRTINLNDSPKQKSARFLDLHTQVISGASSQRILKPLSKAVILPMQSPDILQKLSSESLQKSYNSLPRDSAVFQHPSLKSTREITKFDCWEEKKTLEDWIEYYKSKPAPHGKSPIFEHGVYKWEDVELIGIDRKKFLVRVLKTLAIKRVQRLAIRFNDEDEKEFEARVSQARELQGYFESEMRFIDYIDEVPTDKVSSITLKTKNAIIKKAFPGKKEQIAAQFTESMENLMYLIGEDYIKSMKKWIILLKMRNPQNDPEFISKRIFIRRPKFEIPYFGILRLPYESYQTIKKTLEKIHWYRIPEVVQVNKITAAKCYSFLEQRFLSTSSLNKAIKLKDLYKDLEAHFKAMWTEISIRWREFLISETQDKMSEKYKFFEVDEKEYEKDGLDYILHRLDFIFRTNMQEFADLSIIDWVEFLSLFSEKFTKKKVKDKPLIILNLHLEKSSGKSKKSSDERSGTINFKPTIDEAKKVILECIDWIIQGTNRIDNLHCTLVPFMNFKPEPSFNLMEDYPMIVWAREQINGFLEDYSEEPQQLLKEYKKFEWIGKLKVDEYLKGVFDVKPSIGKLQDELNRFKNAKNELQQLSTNTVNYDFFQIECSQLKEDVRLKIDQVIKDLLDRISKFCEGEVNKINKEYSDMCEKIKTVPTNEDELFELKQFAKNMKSRDLELVKRLKDVFFHYTILEEYHYPIDNEVIERMWLSKPWPREIEIQLKDGIYRLSSAEDKFRQKLEDEKEQWISETNKLTQHFEEIQRYFNYDDYARSYDNVKRLEENLKLAMEKMNSFNIRENLFELNLSDKSELQKMIDEFEPYNKLWSNVNEFKYQLQYNMNEKKIMEVNGNELANLVDKWVRECFMLQKKISGKSPEAVDVINRLKEELNDFQENIPLIKAISNEAWGDEHWKRLAKAADMDPDLFDSKKETVQSLIDKGMKDFLDQIESISFNAQREYKLKKKLDDMKKEYESLVLEILPHKDTYIIKTIEEIQTIIDEQITSVQAMKTSPFIKPIEDLCKNYEYRLVHTQDTLEQWIQCQSVWMNLEPIFSSEDIQKRMPMEYRQFKNIDIGWRNIMEPASREPSLFDNISIDGTTLIHFKDANKNLEEIQKSMHQYLETKRISFPRFFFLSDEDLLDILSQTKDPLRVQEHLNKCFEAIDKVNFSESQEVTHMISPEKENVAFCNIIDVNKGDNKGNVEYWMLDIEKTMFKTLKEITKKSVLEYGTQSRIEWIPQWPSMTVLCVNQIMWTAEAEKAISGATLTKFEDELSKLILDVVKMVRGNIDHLLRKTLSAVITLDVHARDIITDINQKRIPDITHFDWIAQLRYYFDGNSKVAVKMVNSSIDYGFEYLGNTPRLVITPLTDRCYRTLIGAYNLYYGGAPEGPAGTGKTESTKDLAKAVAVKCVVFNCSDSLDYTAMAKFFKGLASSGSWCCFDEFNRIEPEVLSVIAMQVLKIQDAIKERKRTFNFEGTQLSLSLSCAINITMNPGYAGRSELPDNLKALFRPCAMMVPDYAMISEISLYSYGFQDARSIAGKIVASLKLSSEQLSTKDHYDFGMRAVKAILTACGNLKQKYPEEQEFILALRALNDVNLPKFTSEDIPLFLGITSDLFPGIKVPDIDYGDLKTSIIFSAESSGMQANAEFQSKCIQLYETILVRHGLMLVGQTFSGKTQVISCLQQALSSKSGKTLRITLNPKSITLNQLYGRFIPESHQSTDGVASLAFRQFTADKSNDRKWVVFDGPVDSKWIENMNTVLDDNKMLCMPSGEVIKLTDSMTMMFEVEDLKEASPATVSRCGMVYLEPHRLGWNALLDSYIKSLPAYAKDATGELIKEVVSWICWPALEFIRKKCRFPVQATEMELVNTLLQTLDCFIERPKINEHEETDSPVKQRTDFSIPKNLEESVLNWIIFSAIWALGGCLDENSRLKFSEFFTDLLEGVNLKEKYSLLDLPTDWEFLSKDIKVKNNFFDGFYDKSKETANWALWTSLTPGNFSLPKSLKFNELIIPTKDTLRIYYFLDLFANKNKHVLFCGPTGTGKTACILDKLRTSFYNDTWNHLFMNFSAQTSANKTQQIMEAYMEKRLRKIFAPKGNKKLVIFVDDLNMPMKEIYGAQPPIELLRQWMDHGGWYDLESKEFNQFKDIQFVSAMGPPGGGRNTITQRYLRHYHKFYIESFGIESMTTIYSTILDWFFHKQDQPFTRPVLDLKKSLVSATLFIFSKASAELLPTPAKIHYLYNLRDVSKVFQGISKTNSEAILFPIDMIKLWIHECQRVFQDRLISLEDREYFNEVLKSAVKTHFNREIQEVVTQKPLLFASFIPAEIGNRKVTGVYCEVKDLGVLHKTMAELLEYYNQISRSSMNLVLFTEAIEHVVKIVRILQQPLGNALLLGVGGSGRKSLALLASSIVEFEVFEVEISKSFGMTDWRDRLKTLFFRVGLENVSTVFLFSDTQITNEGFLEDINNILNNGDVPNMFEEKEDQAKILEALADEANINKKGGSEEAIQAYFIEKVKSRLHLVLCLSPIGESFRTRLRMFPSLVNCTTIDWFLQWPEEALRSVAAEYLTVDVDHKIREGLIDICVNMQASVSKLTKKYKEELRRYYYVTPTSYLQLISTFRNLLSTKRVEVMNNQKRYQVGLDKLLSTSQKVTVMQKELEILQPQLIKSQALTKEMMKNLTIQHKEASLVQQQCEIDEKTCNEERDKASGIKKECEDRLEEAMPAYNKALQALDTITRGQIDEIKAMNAPPLGVKYTMEAVCKLMNINPIMVPKKSGFGKEPDYWETAKKHVFSRPKLLQDMKNFKKDEIDPNVIANLEKIVNSPDFEASKIVRSNQAAYSISMWVRAMYTYDNVMKVIRPKQAALKEAEIKLTTAESQLAEKRENLRKIEEVVAGLEKEYQAALEKEKSLQAEVDMCVIKLERASKIIDGLKDEKIRWAEEAKILEEKYKNCIGDLLISSGIIAYLGIFTGGYRSGCIENWIHLVRSYHIPSSHDFSLQKVLGDQVKIRDWTMWHLPNDSFSIDNAIIMEYSSRWPLMIDPQVQASSWIKTMEGERLSITRQSNDNLSSVLINSINYSKPILVENVSEELNPELDGILNSHKGFEGTLRVGDKTADVAKDFRIYFTTKLSRPHYSPEVCVKVVLLNFMTTEEGLLDQMLALTVSIESPQSEINRQKCIVETAKCKKEIKATEDAILHNVSTAEGDILDNETLITSLQQSKKISKDNQETLEKQEMIQKSINETRKIYRNVAYRVSQLFFVITDLSIVENMYQYSLEWYRRLYKDSVVEAEKSNNPADRTRNIINQFTSNLYQNVCRSLFEKDKLLFSFLMCIKILSNTDDKEFQSEIRFLMTGSMNTHISKPNPSNGWLENKDWASILEISEFVCFHNFANEFAMHIEEWKEVWNSADPENTNWPSDWKAKLTLLQQVIVLRILRPDKVIVAIEKIIVKELGPNFVSPPPFYLDFSFKDSGIKVPIVFILSPGVDPIIEIEKLALKKGMKTRLTPMSLGDRQGPIAEAALDRALGEGGWVVLQNCHLAASWMPTLEKRIDDIVVENTHEDFRLWLTSMPSTSFPVSVLQNSVKITNEPPKGLKKNLIRSYSSYDHISFEDCKKSKEFKKLVFSLSFFHGVIQERKKFGALGWNIPYEFSMSDLSISFHQLRLFLNEYDQIPWDALKYMVAEANYGGRVTDIWDRRLIKVLLQDYYHKGVLLDNCYLGGIEIYKIPSEGTLGSYIQSIEDIMPYSDPTAVFGLHDNALITSAINDSHNLLSTCLLMIPKSSSTGDKTIEHVISDLSVEIHNRMPELFDIEVVSKKYPIKYNESMNTVLIQELIRFNRLLNVVKVSTLQLRDAVAGLITMSEDLEKVFNALFDNKVPDMWKKAAYPSLKPLAQWIDDFIARLKFMQNWIDNGPPKIFWISGFFFTQSFLTGILQNYARKHKCPIDTICFDFEVVGDKTPDLESGCYIHGLYLDGGKWDEIGNYLAEPVPKILYYLMPNLWLKPIRIVDKPKKNSYECPVYKTSKRQGVLSTTGHSTNFVLSILLNIGPSHNENHWIKRGTALLTQLDY